MQQKRDNLGNVSWLSLKNGRMWIFCSILTNLIAKQNESTSYEILNQILKSCLNSFLNLKLKKYFVTIKLDVPTLTAN